MKKIYSTILLLIIISCKQNQNNKSLEPWGMSQLLEPKLLSHIIDIGKEGGEKGGELICNDIPENIVRCKDSYTGQFLRKELS